MNEDSHSSKLDATLGIVVALVVLFSATLPAPQMALISSVVLVAYLAYLFIARRSYLKAMRIKIMLSIAIALFVAVAVVAGIRFFSGEDDWICVQGAWVQHGHPSAPMPVTPCESR
jgi:hypothetical protein